MTMLPELASLLASLDRQLKIFRQLSAELVACRPAFEAMDLEAIYSHISTQAAICKELQKVEEERAISWQAASSKLGLPSANGDLRGWAGKLEPELTDRFRRVLTELALVEGEVRYLNQIHTVLLDGSRRTLNVLANALSAFSPTYTLPPAVQSVLGQRSQP
jgi:hypothetical protein